MRLLSQVSLLHFCLLSHLYNKSSSRFQFHLIAHCFAFLSRCAQLLAWFAFGSKQPFDCERLFMEESLKTTSLVWEATHFRPIIFTKNLWSISLMHAADPINLDEGTFKGDKCSTIHVGHRCQIQPQDQLFRLLVPLFQASWCGMQRTGAASDSVPLLAPHSARRCAAQRLPSQRTPWLKERKWRHCGRIQSRSWAGREGVDFLRCSWILSARTLDIAQFFPSH